MALCVAVLASLATAVPVPSAALNQLPPPAPIPWDTLRRAHATVAQKGGWPSRALKQGESADVDYGRAGAAVRSLRGRLLEGPLAAGPGKVLAVGSEAAAEAAAQWSQRSEQRVSSVVAVAYERRCCGEEGAVPDALRQAEWLATDCGVGCPARPSHDALAERILVLSAERAMDDEASFAAEGIRAQLKSVSSATLVGLGRAPLLSRYLSSALPRVASRAGTRVVVSGDGGTGNTTASVLHGTLYVELGSDGSGVGRPAAAGEVLASWKGGGFAVFTLAGAATAELFDESGESRLKWAAHATKRPVAAPTAAPQHRPRPAGKQPPTPLGAAEDLAEVGADAVVLTVADLGPVRVALYKEAAPHTVSNFLRLVRKGFYDGCTFYRNEPGFVVQAGGRDAAGKRRSSTATVPLEAWLPNKKGTVALARGPSKHSGGSEFFVNLIHNRGLDAGSAKGGGYAVFGRVVSAESWAVIKKIESMHTRPQGKLRFLDPPVVIESAEVVPYSSFPRQ